MIKTLSIHFGSRILIPVSRIECYLDITLHERASKIVGNQYDLNFAASL